MSIFSNVPLNTAGNFICAWTKSDCQVFVPTDVTTRDEMYALQVVLQTYLNNQENPPEPEPEIDT